MKCMFSCSDDRNMEDTKCVMECSFRKRMYDSNNFFTTDILVNSKFYPSQILLNAPDSSYSYRYLHWNAYRTSSTGHPLLNMSKSKLGLFSNDKWSSRVPYISEWSCYPSASSTEFNLPPNADCYPTNLSAFSPSSFTSIGLF